MRREAWPADFDGEWYLSEYLDVGMLGMDPWEHYQWIGRRLGRRTSPANRKFFAVGDTNDIAFSVIMPTRNRAHCIRRAVDSLLVQVHENFELIIIDDGSTDDTENLIRHAYKTEVERGRIKYFSNETSVGVCNARNIGLAKSTKEWIAYLDSDNTVRPEFLLAFAQAIKSNPNSSTFYANFQVRGENKTGGQPFDLKWLSRGNYIDIGVFCHRRECFKVLGGFDPELRRLVDWELILRYSKEYEPIYIPRVLMDYCNEDTFERITRSESYAKAVVQVHRKHDVRSTVSVVVPCYNQEQYILQALESIASQKGWFTYEIIVSDDGSTDKTPKIVREFCEKNKHIARNISTSYNMGISANFKRCFAEAAGEFIAVLEGDDYWDSPDNLAEKIAFMKKNKDCSMVFSKTQMRFDKNGKTEIRFLDRQEKLNTNKLSGQQFIDDPDMNLIVNFSSCLFRADLLRKLPYTAYHHRLSEITVAFFMEQFGPIGYIEKPLTVYRHHGAGTWSGLSTPDKLRSAMQIRQIVKQVAQPKYRSQIEAIIQNKYLDRLRQMGEAA